MGAFKDILYLITILGFNLFTAYIVTKYGWFTLLVIGLLVCPIAYIVMTINDKLEARKKEITPCCHGVAGALHYIERCKECADKKAIEDALRHAEYQAIKDKEAAEKQRRYDEFVKNLRLPQYLQSMHPREFELIVNELYRRMGYNATPTSYIADNGIDGFLEKDGKKVVLQCKRVKGYVGEPVLRDLFGAMHSTHADSALVVTTGRVSDSAKKWANEKPITIVEMSELRELIDRHFREGEVVPDSYSADMNSITICPRCGSCLRIVKTRFGTCMGCSGYPKCGYKERSRGPYIKAAKA
jgi:restriction system protein